jgi:hypothetical protein
MEPPDSEKRPKKPRPAMIGLPPSARGGRPAHPGLHASQVAQEWEDVGERYVRRRMKEVGIPVNQIGQPDYDGDGQWRAFSQPASFAQAKSSAFRSKPSLVT